MKQNPRFLKHLAGFCAAMALAACGTTSIQTIKVAVPVECRETVPERPVMPTEQFTAAPSLDQFTQAAQAEIERREGYEKRLNAALAACTTPVAL